MQLHNYSKIGSRNEEVQIPSVKEMKNQIFSQVNSLQVYTNSQVDGAQRPKLLQDQNTIVFPNKRSFSVNNSPYTSPK